MATSVTMTYGSYSFTPAPSFSLSRAAERTPGLNFCLSTPVEITLDGIIFPTGSDGAPSGGFGPVTDQIATLSSTFVCGDCETFVVACDGDAFISGQAKVLNLSVDPRTDGDLYVNTAAYSITLEMVSLTGNTYDNQASGITSISEEWNFEILDERVAGTTSGPKDGTISVDAAYNVTHSVTVTAPYVCQEGGGSSIGWEQAADYITNELAVASPQQGVTGLFLPTGMNAYNHFRTVAKNVYDGTITLNDSWVLSVDGALEDFDVSVETSLDSYLTNISVNGNIQGLASITYENPNNNETTKIENAIAKWSGISGDLYSRASTVYLASENINQDSNTMPLNNIPLSTSFGYNNTAGTITYSYSYDNRPYNCVSNARLENITFSENNPNDVFASLTVLGRAAGPLLQDIGTVGQRTREISIEAVLPVWDSGRCSTISSVGAGVPTDYDSLVSGYEANLTGTYSQVFINSESKTWNPKDGRFSFNKSWTVGGCS